MAPQLTAAEKDRERRLQWFRAARFGMFIHWGLYSQLGRHEWVMNRERIPVKEYEPLADTWKPMPHAPRVWAKLAREAGMRYMVMTTKHHEGFCLFNSELTDYCAPKHGPGRDLVAEYVEAARAEGLRVGFYYSMMDWHHPDGARCVKDEAARRRFVDYIHGQVRELCTNYGKLDIMWYDVSWPLDAAGWESAKLNKMVRKLQPDIIINDRSQLPEDFGTPEQHIVPAKGGRAWEACMTFNDSWGYTPIDKNWKTAWHVARMLREVAHGGGNLLLNIGPAPSGAVPRICERELRKVGEWMQKYGPTVYDATDPIEEEWGITGAFTRRGKSLYFHCSRWPGEQLAIGGIQNKIAKARFYNGPAIKFTQVRDRIVLRGLPPEAPDQPATVIELIVARGTPHVRLGCGCVVLDEPAPCGF